MTLANLGISERLENSLPFVVRERDVADGSVLEQQAQLVIADHGDACEVYEGMAAIHRCYGRGSMGSTRSPARASSQSPANSVW